MRRRSWKDRQRQYRPWKEKNPGRRARPIILVRLGTQICQRISSTAFLPNSLPTRTAAVFMATMQRAYSFLIFYKECWIVFKLEARRAEIQLQQAMENNKSSHSFFFFVYECFTWMYVKCPFSMRPMEARRGCWELNPGPLKSSWAISPCQSSCSLKWASSFCHVWEHLKDPKVAGSSSLLIHHCLERKNCFPISLGLSLWRRDFFSFVCLKATLSQPMRKWGPTRWYCYRYDWDCVSFPSLWPVCCLSKQILKEERSILAHSLSLWSLTPLFWVCGKAEHHDWEHITARKQILKWRETEWKDWGPNSPVRDSCIQWYNFFSLGPTS